MKLKFIGEDGSMGFKHGEIYDCHIDTDKYGHVWVFLVNRLGERRRGCPYNSLKLLLENWCEV